MKFPLAQEISRHVRDKICKFYKMRETFQPSATTSTITSSEAQSTQTSPKTFALIASEPNKCESFASCSGNDKVPESPSCLVDGQGLDLIESNFNDILSPTTSYQVTNYNEHEESDFGMIISEVVSPDKTVVISFTCKWCEFR